MPVTTCFNRFGQESKLQCRTMFQQKMGWATIIRAGWVMTGLTIPPLKIFFCKKDTSGDFLDTPGPKKTHLGHFSGVSINTWQLPDISQVYPKTFFCRRPEIFFFYTYKERVS